MVLLAACSSSAGGGSGAGSAPGAGPTGSTTTQTQALTAPQVSWAVNYIGGKKGKANPSLSPVVIGYVNQQGGTLSFPEATEALKATVKFVNDRLGGIDGHRWTTDPWPHLRLPRPATGPLSLARPLSMSSGLTIASPSRPM